MLLKKCKKLLFLIKSRISYIKNENILSQEQIIRINNCVKKICAIVGKVEVMDTAYMADREIRIAENKKNRMQIVRKQQMILAIVIAVVLATTIFLGAAFVTNAQSEGGSYKYYTSVTVSYGDTLTDIAQKYITKEYKDTEAYIREVCAINHLESEDSLLAGTDIIVPYYSEEFK